MAGSVSGIPDSSRESAAQTRVGRGTDSTVSGVLTLAPNEAVILEV